MIATATILELHAQGIRAHGGDGGVRPTDPECVEGKLGNAWSAEGYATQDEHRVGGLIFAAFLLFYLAKGHCFTDGNKRVAWTSAMRVLLVLGLTVTVQTDEAYEFMKAIADGSEISGETVLRWLAERLESAL